MQPWSMLLSLVLLAATVKLLINSHSPVASALVYSAGKTFLAAFWSPPILGLVVVGGFTFGLGLLYFWLLQRTEDTFAWWLVLLGLGVVLLV